MSYAFYALCVLVFLNAGCASDTPETRAEPETVSEAKSALVSENALSPNALSPNALSPNALSPNALSPNALSPNALSPNALSAIKSPTPEGALARELLKYTVSCALPANAAPFSFSWTDSDGMRYDESYPGLLGIAPAWATQPPDDTEKKLVSACLLARVNYLGVSVTISMRSLHAPLKTLVNSDELRDYPRVEGGFWGDLFSTTPYARACYNNDPGHVQNSRLHYRYCATGYPSNGSTLECGMINIIGSCDDYCKGLNGAGQYYPDCSDPVYGKSSLMITTALP